MTSATHLFRSLGSGIVLGVDAGGVRSSTPLGINAIRGRLATSLEGDHAEEALSHQRRKDDLGHMWVVSESIFCLSHNRSSHLGGVGDLWRMEHLCAHNPQVRWAA